MRSIMGEFSKKVALMEGKTPEEAENQATAYEERHLKMIHTSRKISWMAVGVGVTIWVLYFIYTSF